MHDVLFDWQIRYGEKSTESRRLIAGAKALGLDTGQFSACLTSSDAAQFIETANNRFEELNLPSTPSIIINGKLFHPAPNGATEPDLRQYIDHLVGISKAA